LVSELCRSGASKVFEAHVAGNEQPILLKVLDTERLDDSRLKPEEWIFAFDREASLAKEIALDGLPTFIQAGQDGSRRYVAYARISGTPLNTVMSRGKLSADAVRLIIASAAGTLFELHERGFLYCNMLPSTVHVRDDGSALLTDLSLLAPATGP